MSAAAKNKPEGLLGLSNAEARALLLGIVCEDGGKIDMEKLALKYPYKNSSSASTSYRNAKRKLLGLDTTAAADGSAGNGAPSPVNATATNSATTTPQKRTPAAKRKKAAPIDAEAAAAGLAEDAAGSPKPKRQRKTPVKKKNAATKNPSAAEEGGEANEATVKAESNADDSKESVDVKLEAADDHAGNENVKSEETQAPLKLQGHGEDELASIDLDAELDALDTPKSIKDEKDEV